MLVTHLIDRRLLVGLQLCANDSLDRLCLPVDGTGVFGNLCFCQAAILSILYCLAVMHKTFV